MFVTIIEIVQCCTGRSSASNPSYRKVLQAFLLKKAFCASLFRGKYVLLELFLQCSTHFKLLTVVRLIQTCKCILPFFLSTNLTFYFSLHIFFKVCSFFHLSIVYKLVTIIIHTQPDKDRKALGEK